MFSEWKKTNVQNSKHARRASALRIGIIGAGAIGCLFGASLSRVGNEVVMVHRDPRVVSAILRRGVELHYEKGKVVRVRTRAELAPANLVECELVLVTVKAYDTAQAARLHRNYVSPGTQVVSLQNGLGNIETLARIFRRQSILAALTTEASLSLGSGKVIHTGTGETRLGRPDGKVTQESLTIVREFRKAGLKCVVTRNIGGVVWSKAIVNAAINPVSAITRLHNGELAKLPGLRETMVKVIREGVSVSHAEKATATPEPEGFLFKVLKDTAPNRSSMLQDIQRGKRTEILQLNGAITRLGLKHRIPTPTNMVLTSLVLGLETSGLEELSNLKPGQRRPSHTGHASDHRFSKASANTLIMPRFRE